MSDDSVTQWIAQLKAGDQEAANQLWSQYFDRLVRLARQRLGNTQRRVADEEDVALSVFKSLCNGAKRGHFSKLTDRDDLWQLLLTITRQKAVDYRRYVNRKKRGGGKVRGDSMFNSPGADERGLGIDQFMSDDPTPELLVSLDEQFQQLMAVLRDDTLRQTALWRMEGHTNAEIAEKLGILPRSVERKLQLIRTKWSRELDLV